MKIYYILFISLFLFTQVSYSATPKPHQKTAIQSVAQKHKNSSLDGLWHFIGQKINDGVFTNSNPNTSVYKVILNGKFRTMCILPNLKAVLTGEGDMRVVSDTLYTETVRDNLNIAIVGERIPIKYHRIANFLYSRLNVKSQLTGKLMHVEEMWEKIELNHDIMRTTPPQFNTKPKPEVYDTCIIPAKK